MINKSDIFPALEEFPAGDRCGYVIYYNSIAYSNKLFFKRAEQDMVTVTDYSMGDDLGSFNRRDF